MSLEVIQQNAASLKETLKSYNNLIAHKRRLLENKNRYSSRAEYESTLRLLESQLEKIKYYIVAITANIQKNLEKEQKK